MHHSLGRWLPLLVLAAALAAVATLAAGEGLELELEGPPARTGGPQRPVQFNFTSTYNGTQTSGGVVYFHLLDEPEGWTHNFTGRSAKINRSSPLELWLVHFIDVPATVNLTVTPGQRTLGGTYTMSVFAVVEDEEHLNDTLELTVRVPDRFDFGLDMKAGADDGHSALPGESVGVRVDIDNTGNRPDIYDVMAGLRGNATGWSVERVDGLAALGQTPQVAAFSVHRLTVHVAVPEDALFMDLAVLEVTVTSLGEPHGQRLSVSTEVRAAMATDLSIGLPGASQLELDPWPGTNLSIPVRVLNLGNGGDTVVVNATFVGWSEGLGVAVDPGMAKVPVDAERTFLVNVSALEKVPKGIYLLNVSFESTVSGTRTHRVVEVRARQVHGVSIACAEPRQRTSIGGMLDYEVTVRNTGNGIDTIQVGVHGVPPDWLFYLTPPEANLLADQEARVVLRLIVPSRSEEGPLPVYRLRVSGDSVRSEERDETVVEVELEPYYRVEWLDNMREVVTHPERPEALPGTVLPGTVGINPRRDRERKVQLWMRNLGTHEANLTVTAGVEGGAEGVNLSLFPPRVRALHRSDAYVLLTIGFRGDVAVGTYVVLVNLTVDEDPAVATRVAPVTLRFYDVDVAVGEISLTGTRLDLEESGTYTARVGSSLTLAYQVEDAGSDPANGTRVAVLHLSPNGTQSVLQETTIGAFEDGVETFSIEWTAREAGEHTFEVRLQLADQTTEDNDRGTVTVLVREAPPEDAAWFDRGTVSLVAAVVLLLAAVVILSAYLRWRSTMSPED